MRIFEPRILGPNSGVEFSAPIFCQLEDPLKIHPQEIHRPEFAPRESKFNPEIGLKNSHYIATRAAIHRSLRPLRARNRKEVSKKAFSGVYRKVPKTPENV